MLEGLFDEKLADGFGHVATLQSASRAGDASPPAARGASGLVGLENQGATCYLNSVVQVLVASPELRDAILAIEAKDIGVGDGVELPDERRLRRIPWELQKLLGRLLLLDTAAVSTRDLTSSFGWNRMEHVDQHDVQELYRLLLMALEDSLVGTGAYERVRSAIEGEFRTDVRCLACGHVSTRSEQFIDICPTTIGFPSLEASLDALYGTELLSGDNRYRCDSCGGLVDAQKTSRLTRLPPLLAVSLMRFDFDLRRMQRLKDESRFAFPASLRLGAYAHSQSALADADYELYAVVVHSGSAMGGHYRALVRDVEQRGRWRRPAAGTFGRSSGNFGDAGAKRPQLSPLATLVNILADAPQRQMTVDRLGSQFKSLYGRAWSAACRDRHGTIEKFVTSNSHVFELTRVRGSASVVVLKDGALAEAQLADGDVEMQQVDTNQRFWFDFNDSLVSPIEEEEIRSQFSGRESAYMLFYRSSSRLAASEAFNESKAIMSMQPWLRELVRKENEELSRLRSSHAAAVNTVEFHAYHESSFRLQPDGVVWLMVDEQQPPTVVSVDSRQPVSHLIECLDTCMSTVMDSIGCILCLEKTSYGHYCLGKLSDLATETIASTDLMPDASSSLALLCLKEAAPSRLVCGRQHRPVELTFRILHWPPRSALCDASRKFADCLDSALSKAIAEAEDSEPGHQPPTATRVFCQRHGFQTERIRDEELAQSVAELRLRDGDCIVVTDDDAQDEEAEDQATPAAADLPTCFCVQVALDDESENFDEVTVRGRNDWTVGELKTVALQQFRHLCGDGASSTDNWRLEFYDEDLECFCPEHESTPVSSRCGQSTRLVQRPPLSDDEFCARVSLQPSGRQTLIQCHLDDEVAKLRRLAARRLAPDDADEGQYHLQLAGPTGDSLGAVREGSSLRRSRLRHRASLNLAAGPPLAVGHQRLEVFEFLACDTDDWLVLLSQSPQRLFEPRTSLEVAESARVSDLAELLAKQLTVAPWQLVLLCSFNCRSWRLQRSLLPTAEAAGQSVSKAKLAKADTALCFCLRSHQLSLTPSSTTTTLLVTSRQSLPPGAYERPRLFHWRPDAERSLACLRRQLADWLQLDAGRLRLARRQLSRAVWEPLAPPRLYSRQRQHQDEAGIADRLKDGDVVAWTMADGEVSVEEFAGPEDRLIEEQRLAEKRQRKSATSAAGDWEEAASPRTERPLVISVPSYRD